MTDAGPSSVPPSAHAPSVAPPPAIRVQNLWHRYGTHEVQYVSMECPARGGLHINEDAFIVQIVDPETKELLPDGERGNIVYTCLYKTGSPQFRYNIMDLSWLYPREQCACGSWVITRRNRTSI